MAASNGHNEVVEFLLAMGSDVNHQDSKGMTALHLAAQHSSPQHIKIVAQLLRSGINHTMICNTVLGRFTALQLAVKFRNDACADMIKEYAKNNGK